MDDEALACGLNHAPGADKPARGDELHSGGEVLEAAVLVGEDAAAFQDAAVLLLGVLNLPLTNLAGPNSRAEAAVRRLVLNPDLLLRIALDQLVLVDVVDVRLLGRTWRQADDVGLIGRAQTLSPVTPNVRGNLPVEAGAVSPGCDDAPCAAARAYSACRSGSG